MVRRNALAGSLVATGPRGTITKDKPETSNIKSTCMQASQRRRLTATRHPCFLTLCPHPRLICCAIVSLKALCNVLIGAVEACTWARSP